MEKAQAALQKIDEDFGKLEEDRIKAIEDLQKKKDDALQKIEEKNSESLPKNEKPKEKGVASIIPEGVREIAPAAEKALTLLKTLL